MAGMLDLAGMLACGGGGGGGGRSTGLDPVLRRPSCALRMSLGLNPPPPPPDGGGRDPEGRGGGWVVFSDGFF